MNPRPRLRLIAWLSACLLAAAPATALAVSQDALVVAFQNIRSDDVPQNAVAACSWIMAHRDELTPQLLDELYRTDRQGRDVILYALMRTKSYNPDARFCQTLVSRLAEENHYVKNDDLGVGDGVHWYAWTYMDRRYDLFKPLLLANLQTTNDMFSIWGTTTLLQKHGDLAAEEPKFPQHVWDTAAVSLKPDDIEGNAGQAVRFYLLVGPDALPHLKPLETSDDPQTRSLVSATVDALGGSKRAYGYLAMHVNVGRDLFHHHEEAWPQWLNDEAYKWSQLDDSTPYQSQAP
jgi:hypothetical protein